MSAHYSTLWDTIGNLPLRKASIKKDVEDVLLTCCSDRCCTAVQNSHQMGDIGRARDHFAQTG
jgi:hypothetical protein